MYNYINLIHEFKVLNTDDSPFKEYNNSNIIIYIHVHFDVYISIVHVYINSFIYISRSHLCVNIYVYILMRVSVSKLLDDIVNDFVDSHQYFKYVSSSLLIHKGECKPF